MLPMLDVENALKEIDHCKVCYERFSAVSPLLLPCGHSFCETCIDRLCAHTIYFVHCPICRFRFGNRGHFPVNFALRELISRLDDQMTSNTTATVQEIVVESKLDGENEEEGEERIDDSLQQTVEYFKGWKERVGRLVKGDVPEVPEEVKQPLVCSARCLLLLVGLFFSVVVYRYLQTIYCQQAGGYMCGFLHSVDSHLHTSLSPMLCDEYRSALHDLHMHTQQLAAEIAEGVSSVFHHIGAGFMAIHVILASILDAFEDLLAPYLEPEFWQDLWQQMSAAFGELWENVRENVWWMWDAVRRSIDFVACSALGGADWVVLSLHNALQSAASHFRPENNAWW